MKLLICDDDISTIDVIESQIDFPALGIDQVLRAYNGRAGKEMIDLNHPDLILCDIGMPIENGIEVLKHLHDSNLYAEFTFLTCYEDFEYAKEAFKYGASNYLNKPIDFDELKDALASMVSRAKQHKESELLPDKHQQEEARAHNLLLQLQDGYYGSDQERIQSILERNATSLLSPEQSFLPVLVAADITKLYEAGWKRDLLSFGVSRLCEEVLTDNIGTLYALDHITDRYIVVITYVPEEKSSKEALLTQTRRLVRLLRAQLELEPVGIVGDPVHLWELNECSLTLRQGMRKVVLLGSSVYTLEEALKIEALQVPSLDEVALLKALHANDYPSFEQQINEKLTYILNSRGDSSAMMNVLQQDMMQIFFRSFRDNQIPLQNYFQDRELNALEDKACRSVRDFQLFSSTLFHTASSELSRVNQEMNMMNSVKKYLQEHFKEDIDRSDVAAVAYITPNYLSKRFRSEMGTGLRDYINNLRVEEAKKLLLSSNMTISEVASEVGYNNISYFSTVFRKVTGVSPIEWVEQNGKGEAHGA